MRHGQKGGQSSWAPGGGLSGFLTRLAHDRSGNTLMIVAACLLPILAMIGSGIDMSRAYLSQTRLQQACDAGVLAARKRLGSAVAVSGAVPSEVQTFGNKFFDINFRAGDYGTQNRDFQMAVETDYSISGIASVTVPTTLMKIFGFATLPVNVKCEAKLNFSNTDIMMVLDTTGSMNDTNPGDTQPKIQVLRNTVQAFYAQLEASKTPGTRIRYGFVPYSSDVNVGGLLKSEWMVDSWSYSGRVPKATGITNTVTDWWTDYQYVSGGVTYGTAYTSNTCPGNNYTYQTLNYTHAADGTETWTIQINGTYYSCSTSAEGAFTVQPVTYNAYTYTYAQRQSGTHQVADYTWHYQPVTLNVSGFKAVNASNPPVGGYVSVNMGGDPEAPYAFGAWYNGCIEERSTYKITDYANVDFSQALDLDIDTVPTPGNPATQWRPMLPDVSWLRMIDNPGANPLNWSVTPGDSDGWIAHAGSLGTAACPAAAHKLAEMSATDVTNYVNSLAAGGSTYHDIGMIWGGRLLSPNGLFAAENANVGSQATSRNLIFLTDGLTQPNTLTYGAYGIEPLDQRRWSTSSVDSLTTTVESRFTVACNEVKKRNITVWVIGFGQTLNPVLTNCAGPGHSFEANNAAALSNVFSSIAAALGDLRVSK
ncbi:MAG: Tad domain-containing protein [Novosphingobium sp.]